MIQLRHLARTLKMTSPTNSQNLPAQSAVDHNYNSVATAMESSYTSSHFAQDNQAVNFNSNNINNFENRNIQSPYYPSNCFHINNAVVQQNQYNNPYYTGSGCTQTSATNYYTDDYGISAYQPNNGIDSNLTTTLNTPTIETRSSTPPSYFPPNNFNSQSNLTTNQSQQQQLGYLPGDYYLNSYHTAAAAAAAAAVATANQGSNVPEAALNSGSFSSNHYFSNQSSNQLYQHDQSEAPNSGTQAYTFASNRPQIKGEIVATRRLPSSLVANSGEQVAGRLRKTGSESAAAMPLSESASTTTRCQPQIQVQFVPHSNATDCVAQSVRAASSLETGRTAGCVGLSQNFTESLPLCDTSQQQQQQQQRQHSSSSTMGSTSEISHFDLNYPPAQSTTNYQARQVDEIVRSSGSSRGRVAESMGLIERSSSECTMMNKQPQSLLPNYHHQQRQHLQSRETQILRPRNQPTTSYQLINNQHNHRQQYLPSSNDVINQNNIADWRTSSQVVIGEQQPRRMNSSVSGNQSNNMVNNNSTKQGVLNSPGSQQVISRRKNATRETTAALKEWLDEHGQNPYPSKGEKIMLSIITKMTLIQVSTWFANARRRMKKENKIFWGNKQQAAAAAAAAAASAVAATNATSSRNATNPIRKTGEDGQRVSGSVSGSTNNRLFGQSGTIRYLLQKHHRHLKGSNSMLATQTAPISSNKNNTRGHHHINDSFIGARGNQLTPSRNLSLRLKSSSPKQTMKSQRIEAKTSSRAKTENKNKNKTAAEIQNFEQSDQEQTEEEDSATPDSSSLSSEATSPDSSASSSSSTNVGSSTLALTILSSSVTNNSSTGSRSSGDIIETNRRSCEKEDNDSIDKKDS